MDQFKSIFKYIIISLLIILMASIFSPVNAADLEVIIDQLEVKQGGIIKAVIKSDTIDLAQDNYSVEFNSNNFSFYPSGKNQLITYIGISYWTKTGKTPIKLKKNNKNFYYNKINIIDGNFSESYIEVSEKKEELVRPGKEDKVLKEKLTKDKKRVRKARTNTSSKKLWEENFIWPLKGTITTGFGATRYVNGKLQSKHSGIDIAADRGVPVKASNSGRVTLAYNLTVTGKTIIIDHGQAIFSSYSHLNNINVRKGELVKKGQQIGQIGSTGFSTGPHLHWTIKTGNVYVNPKKFVE